jgi:hypothetical protein
MTFENYGKLWCIDHIFPISLYRPKTFDDVKKCFNLNNLQPIYKEENAKKNAHTTN